MSYCSENNTRCDRTRFVTAMGSTAPGWVQVPIFAPGTLAVASLQIAINRLQPGLQDGAYKLLNVDGILGTKTIAAMKMITILTGADDTIEAIHAAANKLHLPELQLQPVGPFAIGDKSAPPPPPAGTPGLPQSGMSTMTIVVAAAAVGIAFALMSKKKGRR